ncbi:MAG: hypothetical protein JWQ01_1221 [Massilia sp.]|nr:hypothetical protein [Massilia sp.]
MNPLQTNMLNALVGAAIAIGSMAAATPARADAFAQSILVIDNLRLLHANGTAYTASDFATLAGANMAQVSGQFNGVFASQMQSGDAAGANDIARQSVGTARAAHPENSFTPMPGRSGPAGDFGSADQQMSGGLITTTLGAAGALIQTRADAALTGAGAATGNAGVAAASTFSFALGADEFMTISFDAFAFTQAHADDHDAAAGSANAHLAWSISVLDLTTGATVFTFQPEQLNGMSDVSRTEGQWGISTYDPGMMSFSATTGLLAAGDTYQVTIAQSTFAGALQTRQVPEPATLAVFGAGLLAMAAIGRRRRH